MSRRRGRPGLAARLFAAQLPVIVTGSLTLALTALAVAPGLFRVHARQAFAVLPAGATDHLEQGFEEAMLVAVAIAAAACLVTALAASWLLSHWLTRPLRSLAHGAERSGAGSYQARVPVPTSDDELAALGSAFNRMAHTLESTERRQALLADLAHELRTPLATLEGYVEGTGRRGWSQQTRTRLDRAAGRAGPAALVEDLEILSRAEQRQLDLRPGPVDAGGLMTRAVQAAEPAYAAKGVALQASVDRPLRPVSGDPDRLGEVLGNLLGNALRHTPPGGRVQVSAYEARNQVEPSVADTGEGIPPELLDRLFARFLRVDPAHTSNGGGGSGLGLTISRAIVEAQGGRVWAESAGRGRRARFVVRLPTIPARAQEPNGLT